MADTLRKPSEVRAEEAVALANLEAHRRRNQDGRVGRRTEDHGRDGKAAPASQCLDCYQRSHLNLPHHGADDPTSLIYHLHYRILEVTGGVMGLIRCDSSVESMFDWKNDPSIG